MAGIGLRQPLIALILLLLLVPLSAHEKILHFTQFTVEDGLASMETYDVIQDQKGYIWIGTDAGLCRFDGYSFRVFTTRNGLSNNDVINLYEGAGNRIWIQSLGPLAYLENGRFHLFKPEGFEYDNHWFSFIELKPDLNLITSRKKFYSLNAELELTPFPVPFTPRENSYTRIFEAEEGAFWAFNKQSFYLVESGELTKSLKINSSVFDKSHFFLKAHQNYLYYASEDGLGQINIHTGDAKMLFPNLKEIKFLEVFNHQLWIGDSGAGLWVAELDEEKGVQSAEAVLEEVSISSVIQDSEGNFWVATYGQGLYFLPANSEKIEVLNEDNGLGNAALESVLATNDKIWIGNARGELRYIQGDRIRRIDMADGLSDRLNRIIGIDELSTGQLILATDKGTFLWDGDGFFQILDEPTKALYLHAEEELILSTSFGVVEIPLKCLLDNAKPGVSLRDICGQYYTRLRKNRSYAVFKDESGQYWCDDVRNGLVTVKDSEAFFWSEIGPAFRSNISEILQLDNGIIALATQGEGVILVRGQEYLQINTEQGLSGDICNDMITDGENLWVATNRGVTSIKQISFENKSYQLDIYNHLDGLITNEIKALARLDGVLFLASPGGLIRFREKELSENSILPRIDITQFIINEKDTLVASGYQLRPNQNNIRIHFVGLSFRNLGNLVYKYKLDGVDEDWIKTTALETHYSKLPPGKYQFMVSAIGPQGIESQNIETLAFTIKPAFGQTFLFKLILALIGCIILLVLFYLLYTTLQRKQLERKVALQTRQLNQKVAALAELNEKLERSNKELAEFAHVASHDLKSPLRNVASFVQLLKRRGKDRLNETDLEFIEFAVKGVNHMDKVINDLLTMSKVNQFDKKKESVDFGKVVSDIVGEMQLEISEQNAVVQLKNSLPTLHFSATNAKQLFQNLISNALKYQDKPQPRVEVGCQQQNGHYQFFVKDNGIGIEPEYQSKVFMMFQRLHTQSEFSGTGIGLSICKKIVENNKGIIWFESTPGEGTTFFFTLPKHVR